MLFLFIMERNGIFNMKKKYMYFKKNTFLLIRNTTTSVFCTEKCL